MKSLEHSPAVAHDDSEDIIAPIDLIRKHEISKPLTDIEDLLEKAGELNHVYVT